MISLDILANEIGATDEADLPKIERWRDAALESVETATRHYFGLLTATTEFIRGNGTRSIWLSEPGTITSVTEYAHVGATGTAITGAQADGWELRVSGTQAELLRKGGGGSGVWTFGYDYAVTYTRGYAVNGLPKDIQDVVIELVRTRYSTGGGDLLKKETVGGYSYERFDTGESGTSLSQKSQDTIERWRRLVFA